MPHLLKECAPRCRSKNHAAQLVSACTKGNIRQLQLYLSTCYNAGSTSDRYGRTVLHMAASRGLVALIQWLCEEHRIDLSARDAESGWTALHRALFYGQIAAARLLMKHSASVHTRDKEGLTALDVTMKDRLPHVQLIDSGLYETYTWGENSNFTLGHETELRRRQPESIDYFRKNGISIKQVEMNKYHTVFLDANGKVYTCGHGRGGRLGHSNEQTYMTPKLLESVQSQVCVQVAAGRDHTVVLMDSGCVFVWGLNEYNQLGLNPPPDRAMAPRMLNAKLLKGKLIKGVCANRFHTVLYTEHDVYTFGLNAGQLGHQKVTGDNLLSTPRMVSAFNHHEITIKMVAVSDAATAVVTGKGDVYVLHEYQCRKIVSKWLDIKQISVSGGHLDHRSDLDTLQEKGGYELVIMLLNSSGKVYLWRASDQNMKRCKWSVRRPLYVHQMSLSVHNYAFVTSDGEAFKGTIPKRIRRESLSNAKEHGTVRSADTLKVSVSDLLDKEETEHMPVERLPAIHRAVSVAMDNKGNNYSALQAQPNASLTEIPTVGHSEMCGNFRVLLEEANEFDLIHDVVIQLGNHQIPAHKYILACKSDYFRRLFLEKSEEFVCTEKMKIALEDVNYDIFMQLLKYMYTDTCDLLNIDAKPNINLQHGKGTNKKEKGKKMGSVIKEEETKINLKSQQSQWQSSNPVSILKDMAKKFVVKSLIKRLEAVKWSGGQVKTVQGRSTSSALLRFDQNKYNVLYDVCIKSEDGLAIKCHKCVLVSRLEYFHSMLGSGWIETNQMEGLMLPIPADILRVVITYLYTDDAPVIKSCENAEFVCNVLVVADQLLISRLKNICEVSITSLLTLKNVCEVLEFACTYNADQLKRTCQQFICLNLAAVLEARSLDILSDDVVQDLTVYYRNLVSGMERRLVTPFDETPSFTELESLEAEYASVELSDVVELGMPSAKDDNMSVKKKSKRTRTRSKSIGEDLECLTESQQRPRQMSINSVNDFPVNLNVMKEEIQTKSFSSPARPVLNTTPDNSTVSLRDIMRNQMQVAEVPMSSTATAVRKAPKISNNEKRRLAKQQQLQTTTAAVHDEKGATAKPAWGSIQPQPAWGTMEAVTTSFKDLMIKEEKVHTKTPKASSSSPVAAQYKATSPTSEPHTLIWGLPQMGSTRGRTYSESQGPASPLSPMSPTSMENPWQRPKSGDGSAVCFTDIVKDEEQQMVSLQKAITKPLALIQIEEQAIQELRIQYAADSNVEEYITVTRVASTMATPTWKASS